MDIVAHLVYELDPDGRQLRVALYDYAAERSTLCPTAPELRAHWPIPQSGQTSSGDSKSAASVFSELAEATKQPDADPFDLLCHPRSTPCSVLAASGAAASRDAKGFLDRFAPQARQIIEELLDKYAEFGDAQFVLPEALQVPPISAHGQVGDIVRLFGGPEHLRNAVTELQTYLYAA